MQIKKNVINNRILNNPWTSNISKRYKRNSIKTELYRAKRISSNFTSEVAVIRNKFESAGYPKRFVNSIIREFNAVKENEESDFIIPPWLFEGKKKVVLVEIPFCLKNEISSKHFIKKFNKFTNNTFDVRIKWLTQKVKNLFRLKDKSLHQACKIYKGICSCVESYIGETVRNVEGVGVSTTIQQRCRIHQNTLKIMSITCFIGR